jgi:hypothetical protein
LVGCWDLQGASATTTVEAYTVTTNSWAAAADYPIAASNLAAVTLDGKLYTAGGRGTEKTYRYDPTSGAWDDGPIADLPVELQFVSGLLYNGTWILAGGVPAAVIGWDPRTNYWRSLDQIPTSPFLPVAATADDAFYVLSSETSGAVQRYIETNCASPTPTATEPGSLTPTPPTGVCIGDCGNDLAVTVADLVKGVSIALDLQPLDGCPTFDGDSDGSVAINELVAAVNNALNGCPRA